MTKSQPTSGASPLPTAPETERQKFDAWFDSEAFGNVDSYIEERMWKAWQARAGAASPTAPDEEK